MPFDAWSGFHCIYRATKLASSMLLFIFQISAWSCLPWKRQMENLWRHSVMVMIRMHYMKLYTLSCVLRINNILLFCVASFFSHYMIISVSDFRTQTKLQAFANNLIYRAYKQQRLWWNFHYINIMGNSWDKIWKILGRQWRYCQYHQQHVSVALARWICIIHLSGIDWQWRRLVR